ncbi:MAG: DUF1206 domain-containing protein [Allosphingosinicella sp.]
MLSVGKLEAMTRAGFAARGIMYLLIGFLSLGAGRAQDGSGALRYLDSGPGEILLALMALGFFGYGLWRLSEAAVDTEGHGDGAKGAAVRIGGAVSGFIHLGLGLLSAKLALGGGGGGGSSSSEQGAETALGLPGGTFLLTAAAIVLVAVGLYQLAKAWKADFLKHLEPGATRQAWVVWIGRAGYAARGVVFAIMGWFLWQAARESQASEAGDMGAALTSLPGTLQAAVAAGLMLFGLFSLVEARFRRINDPKVVERLRQRAHA